MHMKIIEYYKTANVQSRMIEFLGGHSLDDATCFYIGRCWDTIKPGFNMRKPGNLDLFLDNEWDVARSLWDKEWLMVDLDIEYTNFEFPAEPFLDYQRTFGLQQPVLHAILRMLSGTGIQPLHSVSGRGHHFVWKVHPASPAFEQLVQVGRLSPALTGVYSVRHPPDNQPVDLRLGKAFSGLGLVMEYVAYRVLAESQSSCLIPVFPEAVDFGPQERGREMISLDISEYADPLHTRGVRMPFSIYIKPWQHPEMLNPQIEGKIPVMVMVPSNGLDTHEVAAVMRDLGKAAEWASHTSGIIPDHSHGMEALISLYLRSDVRQFHDWFYSVEPEPPERWPVTYDRVPVMEYPPHIRYTLEHPNEPLLRPGPVRQLVAFLLEQGWHPRHIAGLIRSKYERNYGWLNQWYIYDAGMRADFHARVLSGLIKMGYDHLADIQAAVPV
jgi:hypothetical protein